MTEIFFISAIAAAAPGLVYLFRHLRRSSEHTVQAFQRAVFFRNGRAYREIGPGVHDVLRGRDYVIYGDVRPIRVSVENQQVAIKDGSFARYSFFADVDVQDFWRALYSARTFSEMPFYILRRDVRASLARGERDCLVNNREAFGSQLEKRVREELQRFGFELTAFRISQLQISEPLGSQPSPEFPPVLLN